MTDSGDLPPVPEEFPAEWRTKDGTKITIEKDAFYELWPELKQDAGDGGDVFPIEFTREDGTNITITEDAWKELLEIVGGESFPSTGVAQNKRTRSTQNGGGEDAKTVPVCPGCGNRGAVEHPEVNSDAVTCTNDDCGVYWYDIAEVDSSRLSGKYEGKSGSEIVDEINDKNSIGESSSSSKDKRLGPTKTTSKQSKGGGEPPNFDLVTNSETKYIRDEIQKCSIHDHIQQVAYSTYHDALTQVCFDCELIRTNLEEVFNPE